MNSQTADRAFEILVVEDDEDDWFSIERALRKAGRIFNVSRVSGFGSAITAIRHKQYDCILLDLLLQEDGPINGIDTVVAVVKEAPNTPIVVLSTITDVDTAIQAVDFGASAYIEKPPPARHLESIIRQSIEKHVREEVIRRLTRESIDSYGGGENTPAVAMMVGAFLDEIEGYFHLIRAHLKETAPRQVEELDKFGAWKRPAAAFQEIRKILHLEDQDERETWPPSEEPPKRKRKRAISARAMEKVREAAEGGSDKIKTPDDARAFLLSVQSEPKSEPPLEN